MSSKEKLIKRFISLPSDFTWDEMQRLLTILGFVPYTKGKTSGSRIIFKSEGKKPIIKNEYFIL